MEIQYLYDFAKQQNIEVLSYSMPQNESMSVMLEDGKCFIGMDESVRMGASRSGYT